MLNMFKLFYVSGKSYENRLKWFIIKNIYLAHFSRPPAPRYILFYVLVSHDIHVCCFVAIFFSFSHSIFFVWPVACFVYVFMAYCLCRQRVRGICQVFFSIFSIFCCFWLIHLHLLLFCLSATWIKHSDTPTSQLPAIHNHMDSNSRGRILQIINLRSDKKRLTIKFVDKQISNEKLTYEPPKLSSSPVSN